jgi:hypothetical protein
MRRLRIGKTVDIASTKRLTLVARHFAAPVCGCG